MAAPQLKAGPGSVKVTTSGSSSYELSVAYTLHAPGTGEISARGRRQALLTLQTPSRQSWSFSTPSRHRKSACALLRNGAFVHARIAGQTISILSRTRLTAPRYWKPQLDDPEFGQRYACMTFDFPGHALSPTHGRAWSHWDMAQAVLAALDQVGVPRAVVIGVSQGGFTAYRIAMLDQKRAGITVERKILGIVSAGSSIDPEAKSTLKRP